VNNPYRPPDASTHTQYRENIANHLLWAILSTVFCCLPLGVVSIVYAAKVDGLVASGDMQAARDASDKAKKWAIWAACVQGGIFALYLLFILIMVVIGMAQQ